MKKFKILLICLALFYAFQAKANNCSTAYDYPLSHWELSDTINLDSSITYVKVMFADSSGYISLSSRDGRLLIDTVELYSGTCGSLTYMDYCIAILDAENAFSYHYNNLTTGVYYYLKIKRAATIYSSSTLCNLHLTSGNSSSVFCGVPHLPICNLIPNWSFEEFSNPHNIDPVLGTVAPFNEDNPVCLDGVDIVCNWDAASGTPDINTPTLAGGGTFFAETWGQAPSTGRGEGIVCNNLGNTILSGHVYMFGFMFREVPGLHNGSSQHISQYQWELANQATSTVGICSWDSPPPGGQNIFYTAAPTGLPTTWTQRVKCFTANNNYDQLYSICEGTMIFNTQSQGDILPLVNVDLIQLYDMSNTLNTSVTTQCGIPVGLGGACDYGPLTPNVTYLWTPGNFTTQTITVSPNVTTTYTKNITITDWQGNQCTTSENVTVTVVPYTGSIQFTPPNPTFCVGSSVNVTASLQPATSVVPTYTWSPATGLNTTVGSTITANPSSTTTYTCIASFSGCNVTAQVTVTPSPNPVNPVITGPTSACELLHENNVLFQISNYNSAYGYSASLNGSTILVNSSTFSIAWPVSFVGGTLVVTAINSFGCSATTTFYIQDCCMPSNGLTPLTMIDGDNEADLAAAAGSAAGSVSGLTGVFINGVFNITQDFSILNCHDFHMAAGSKIKVANNVKLTIVGTRFFAGCCNMWKGFELGSGSSIFLTTSIVEDAQFGIRFTGPNITYTLQQSEFINDYIGLLFEYGSSIVGNPVMEDVKFNCNSMPTCPISTSISLSKPYQGQFPTPKDYSLAGIRTIYTPSIQIGNNNSYPDRVSFSHLYNGVVASGGQLVIANTTFDDMIHSNSSMDIVGNASGTAIYNFGTIYLSQTGYGVSTTDPVVFNNCYYDMYVRRAGLTSMSQSKSTNNYFSSVFITEQQPSTICDISNNDFKTLKYALYSQYNTGGAIDYYSNTIESNNSSAPVHTYCIRAVESPNNANVLTIRENTIDLYKTTWGITLQSTNNSQVLSNNINLNTTSSLIGVNLAQCTNDLVQCNVIEASTLSTDKSSIGIYLNNPFNNTIKCNTTDKTYFGIKTYNNCSSTQLIANEMKSHYTGLSLNTNAIMGTQNHNGNIWTGPFTQPNGYAAMINSSVTTSNRFNVSSIPLNNAPFLSPWFFFTSGTDKNCSSTPCTNPQLMMAIGDEDYLIANSDEIESEFEEENNFALNKSLYEKLFEMSARPAYFETFFNDMKLQAEGKLVDLEKDLKSAENPDAVLTDFINDKRNEMHDNALLIKNISAQAIQSGSWSASDKQWVEALNQSILDDQDLVNLLMDQLKAQQVSALSNVKQTNDAIAGNELYVLNEKVINDIYATAIQRPEFEFTQDEKTIIESIAAQCALSGGKGVYKARALMPKFNDDIVYDDEALCEGSLRRGNAQQNNYVVPNNGIRVYPQPAGDKIIIDSKELLTDYILYNFEGRIVQQGTLTKDNSIEVKALDNGLYLLVLKSDEKQFNEKIIISH